jgi:hypothetical protein
MKHTQTMAGILVVVLLGAGVYWARTRNASVRATPTAGAAGSITPMAGAHGAALTSDEALPDLSKAEASAMSGGVMLIASLDPQPPVAYARFTMRVRAEVDGKPVAIEGGKVWFEMVMPMGDHRYTLVSGPAGVQQAEVTLPMCKSGNPRWFANFEGAVAGQPRRARFRLDLTPPK